MPFHDKDAPPSAPSPRQSEHGVYTPRTPSGTPRSSNINWGESLLAQPNFLLENQESHIINVINSIHKKIEEMSHNVRYMVRGQGDKARGLGFGLSDSKRALCPPTVSLPTFQSGLGCLVGGDKTKLIFRLKLR